MPYKESEDPTATQNEGTNKDDHAPQLEVTSNAKTRDMGTAMTQEIAGDILTARTLEEFIYEAQQQEQPEMQKLMETIEGDEFKN